MPASWPCEIPANDITVRRLYDGGALVAEYDQTGTMLRRFVHGPNTGADTPLVWYEGPTMSQAAARMLNTDLQGSVTSVTDFGGNPVAINRYDEYGRPQTGNTGRFQYTGQAWLPEIGLYYYKARMYSPTLGRFMQTDPIGYADGVNWYNYVGGDPVNGVDPSGLYEWFCKKHIVSLGGVDHVGETCGYRPEPGDSWLWPTLPEADSQYESGGGPQLSTPCETPPPGPPGTTSRELADQARRNAALAEQHRFNLIWFRDQVKNRAPWDYKQYDRSYERFGNYNYGYSGAALGLPSNTLLEQAGIAQGTDNTSRPEWNPRMPTGVPGLSIPLPPFGDDPRDQADITQGVRDYHRCYP